ncbi:MAG: hypothetical protein AB7G80_08925 [Dongiaceae bacterium]
MKKHFSFTAALLASGGIFAAAPRQVFAAPPATESIAGSDPAANSIAESIKNIEASRAAIENHLLAIKSSKARSEQNLAETRKALREGGTILVSIKMIHNRAEEEIKLLRSDLIIAHIQQAKSSFRLQEELGIQKLRATYPGLFCLSPEEAHFMVVKARTVVLLQSLDPSSLSAEKKEIFEAYRQTMIPEILAASWKSPLGDKIMEMEGSTSIGGVICRLIPVPKNPASQKICEVIVDKVVDELRDLVKDKIIEKYKEKFKNLSPVDAVRCIHKAIETSWDQNTRNLLNPYYFGPYQSPSEYNFGPTGIGDLFNNPHQTFDFETPFNQALDFCIEERNKKIEQEREESTSSPPTNSSFPRESHRDLYFHDRPNKSAPKQAAPKKDPPASTPDKTPKDKTPKDKAPKDATPKDNGPKGPPRDASPGTGISMLLTIYKQREYC